MNESTHSPLTVEQWAGAQHLALTLLFTDIVDSTAIGTQLGDNRWIDDLFNHFARARYYAVWYDCIVVKVIGDSLMMAFRTSSDAVLFALNFAADTGVDYISIRVGINSGQVQIRENDIYGLTVNFTSRVQHLLPGEGILISDSVKDDYEKTFGGSSETKFIEVQKEVKSFGSKRLWRVVTPSLREKFRDQAKVKLTKFSIKRHLPIGLSPSS